ncbi:alpha/beta hydrolase [Nocardia niigatensis]
MANATTPVISDHAIEWKRNTLYAWEMYPASGPVAQHCTAVLLHGAGRADSSRVHPLAEAFARRGVRSVGLDFVGHGRTGGSLLGSSLDDRLEQALAVVDSLAANDSLIICGFSMSGHTTLRLTCSANVLAIGLFCPAVYSAAAEPLPFGPQFSSAIRTENSWIDSPALKAATLFRGRAAICIGQKDDVIPWPVVEHITSSLRQNSSELRLDVLGLVGHQIGTWMADNPSAADSMAAYLTSCVSFDQV